jgi:hypothetical protein
VLFALEPRSYSQSIGQAVSELRPGVGVAVVEPEELPAEVEKRLPTLVLSGNPRPRGLNAAVKWAQFSPYEEPQVVRVNGHPEHFPDLGLEDLLGLVDRLCENGTQRHG